jgi:2'-5' RNA ligase
MTMGDKIRTFIALPLSDTMQEALGRLQEDLRCGGLSARWVTPASVHLTLRFIGDIPSADVEPIAAAMAAAAAGCRPLRLQARGMGVFPGIRKARVLWVGMGGETEALFGFQQRLETELAAVGVVPETRRFRAHLTLARFKDRPEPGRIVDLLDRFSDYTAEPFWASELVLFRSRLTPEGAVYTRIKEILLAPSHEGRQPAEGNGRTT